MSASEANKILRITTPLDLQTLQRLKAGDEVLLSGVIYTARDQAHRRLAELIKKGATLPLELKGQCVYYCGPTPPRPGKPIGACGPTTAGRMDSFTAPLLEAGMKAMIGKGRRSEEARRLIRRHKAIYFLATGGAGALLAQKVMSCRCVCFKELGPEAVYRLEVKDVPLIVGIDAHGHDIY